MTEFHGPSWLIPMIKKTEAIREETEKIREETERLREKLKELRELKKLRQKND